MRPIACATEDKREDQTNRAAQCFNYSVHDYVPFSALESVTRERDAAVRRVGELEPIAAAYRELGEAWSVSREHFRIVSKPYPLAANEKLPTSIEYASASERAYSAIDRAVAFARTEKEPSDV
jgi:hypothetical protein